MANSPMTEMSRMPSLAKDASPQIALTMSMENFTIWSQLLPTMLLALAALFPPAL